MAPTPPLRATAPHRRLLVLSLLLLLLLVHPLTSSAHPLTTRQSPPARQHAPTAPPAAPKARGETAGISAGLVSTLRETLGVIRDVASIISAFPIGGGGDLRLSSAVADCLDLLDLSSDELSWSMSATSSPDYATAGVGGGGRLGTGDARSDLRSWLSGALGNQDTCKEGLDQTGSVLGSLVAAGLESVTSLLADGLGQVAAADAIVASSSSSSPSSRRGLCAAAADADRQQRGHPRWLRARERRLLRMPVGPGGLVMI